MEKLIRAWFSVCPQLSELFGLSEPQLPRGTQGGDVTRCVDSSQHRCIHCKWEVTMSPWCGEWQYKQLTFMDCLLCARCWAQHIACAIAFDPYTIPMGHVYYCPVSLLIKSRLREAWRVPRSHSQEVGEPELRLTELILLVTGLMCICKYFENWHHNVGDIGRMFWQSFGGGNRVTLARKSPGSSSCSHLAHYNGPGSSVNASSTLFSRCLVPSLLGWLRSWVWILAASPHLCSNLGNIIFAHTFSLSTKWRSKWPFAHRFMKIK